MSWCDKLSSTAAVGIRLNPHVVSAQTLLDILSPMLDSWFEGRKQKFSVEKVEGFGLELQEDDGYYYGVDAARVFVDFRHRLRPKHLSGAAPIAEVLSKQRPFSELLPELSKRLRHTANLLTAKHSRTLERVGIVSTTIVTEEEAPPGVRRLLQYVSRPWNGDLDQYKIHLTSRLKSSAAWEDRCLHSLTKAEDEVDGLLTIKLDFHRTLTRSIPATDANIAEQLNLAEKDAVQYFEDIAEGNRFDENILRETARPV